MTSPTSALKSFNLFEENDRATVRCSVSYDIMMDYILKSLRPAKVEGMLTLVLHPSIRQENDEKRLTVSEGVYAQGGSPLVGEIVDGKTVEFFVSAVERRESVKSALRLLGYSDKSQRALMDMLIRRGYTPEVAKEATEEAIRLGYLNERRAVEHAVVYMVEHKHYGARRIIPALVSKGYAKPLVHEVISSLVEAGEIDFQDAFKALLLKKRVHEIENTEERKEKIKKLAYQYGFK